MNMDKKVAIYEHIESIGTKSKNDIAQQCGRCISHLLRELHVNFFLKVISFIFEVKK